MTLYKAPPPAMASEDRTRVRFAPGSQILSAESLRTGYPDMTSDGIRRPQHERLIWTGIDNQALDSAEDDEDVFKYRSVNKYQFIYVHVYLAAKMSYLPLKWGAYKTLRIKFLSRW